MPKRKTGESVKIRLKTSRSVWKLTQSSNEQNIIKVIDMFQLWTRIFSSVTSDPLKMVLVVRGDLKMGKGKTAAQCAHASILCYEKCLHKNPKLLQIWTDTGQPKVVLKAESLSEMESIYRKANDANIVAALVRDAGRTQLPAGSVTVLGIGPDTIENIDQLAKHLKLL